MRDMNDYGGCASEQAFKMEWIKRHAGGFRALFCVETEETVPGFPDVLGIRKDGTAVLLEFKRAGGRDDRVRFEPTQPAFMRKCLRLGIPVCVVAMESDGRCLCFPAAELLDSGLISVSGGLDLTRMRQHLRRRTLCGR